MTNILLPVQGCSFGYHAGGWGKPPVDEMGKPLYGDVFGTNADDFQVSAELVYVIYCFIYDETTML